MRNWTLTPVLFLSLGGALLPAVGIQSETASPITHRSERQQALDLAGSRLLARQLGPLHAQDLDVGFSICRLSGPLPILLSAWVGEARRPHDAALVSPGPEPLLLRLDLPHPSRWDESHLWLEVEQSDGGMARGAYALQRS